MPLGRVFGILRDFLQVQLFKLGETYVTVLSLVLFLAVLLAFLLFSRLVVHRVLGRVLARFRIEEGVRYTLLRLVHYLVLVVGALVAFQFVGIDLSGLVVVLGFLSVGIGFGLQNLTSNFISGLILLFERPIRVGDRITVGDTEGDVEEINMRSTTVRSLNNISIIVPNSEFVSSRVINWSHGDPRVRLDLDVGVSYDSDLELVLRALGEVAAQNAEVLEEPPPEVLFVSFGDSAWNLQLRVWVANPKRHQQVRSAINCAIVRKFRANQIEIPFPQRDLHLRSPLPLPYRPAKLD